MTLSEQIDLIQATYITAFGRPSDPAGMRYWLDQLPAMENPAEELMLHFTHSQEFASLYGNITQNNIKAVISTLYLNAFNEAITAELADVVTGLFFAGDASLAQLVLRLRSEVSAELEQALKNKVFVANSYNEIVTGKSMGDLHFGQGEDTFDGIFAYQILGAVTKNQKTILSEGEIAYLILQSQGREQENVLKLNHDFRANHSDPLQLHQADPLELKKFTDPADGAIVGSRLDDYMDLSMYVANNDNSSAGFTIFGGFGNDMIVGSNGNDTIYGGSGNDHIEGMGGNDIIFGGSGNDLIYGIEGTNILRGGEGDDSIWGGTGKDFFVFEESGKENGIDLINNFEASDGDVLDFSLFFKGIEAAIPDVVYLEFGGNGYQSSQAPVQLGEAAIIRISGVAPGSAEGFAQVFNDKSIFSLSSTESKFVVLTDTREAWLVDSAGTSSLGTSINEAEISLVGLFGWSDFQASNLTEQNLAF